MTSVGKPIKAAEFLRLIKGEGTYIDDIHKDSPLFLKVIRSPYAHAKIRSIDFGAASEKSLLLITSKLVSDKFSGAMLPALQIPQANTVKMPTLAMDKVNFVGQPVAAVVGRDRYEAEDLLDLVSVDYEP
ncbi:MAG: xanthine dehydrogenase family protein molybdopterin-binding subunit, partial [Nitrososphaerales archaeon]